MIERMSFIVAGCVLALGMGCDGPAATDAGCAMGMICLDGATPDGGVDAARPDTGPPPACGSPGQVAGSCRAGACRTGLQCAVEWGPTIPGQTTPSTLGEVFGFNSATEDPAHPGEYISSGMTSTIAVNFAPGGGQCTQACLNATSAMPDDGCGTCSSCNNTLGGGGPAFSQLSAQGLAVTSDFMGISDFDTQDGICRLNCAFDPATNGGCPTGYTCDPGYNICVEACVSNEQCNANFGLSRTELWVIYDTGDGSTCNMTTGRCEHVPPATAGLNTACDSNVDCPLYSLCLIGNRCGTLACADSTGMMAGPVACAGDCLGFGGNNGSICVQGCTVPTDCFPGQGCSPTTAALPSGATGFCIGFCEADAECRSTERCHLVREDDPEVAGDSSLSICDPFCDPDLLDGAAVADAIVCEAGEACVRSGTAAYGYCEGVDQLCSRDTDCNAGQGCFVENFDLLGRCVDGCQVAGGPTPGMVGFFGRDITGFAGTISFAGDGTFAINSSGTAAPETTGLFSVTGTTLTLRDTGGTAACAGVMAEATYTIAVSATEVTLAVATEPCAARETILVGTWTRRDCFVAAESCVVYDDGDATTNPTLIGVCRAPGGACAASPVRASDMFVRQPMLGDEQCVPSQECSQTMATDPPTTGTCRNRP